MEKRLEERKQKLRKSKRTKRNEASKSDKHPRAKQHHRQGDGIQVEATKKATKTPEVQAAPPNASTLGKRKRYISVGANEANKRVRTYPEEASSDSQHAQAKQDLAVGGSYMGSPSMFHEDMIIRHRIDTWAMKIREGFY